MVGEELYGAADDHYRGISLTAVYSMGFFGD